MRISIIFGFLLALFAITTASVPAQALPSAAQAKQIGVQSTLDSVDYYGYRYNNDCYRPRHTYYRKNHYHKSHRYYTEDRYYGSYYYPKHHYRKHYYSHDNGYYSNDDY